MKKIFAISWLLLAATSLQANNPAPCATPDACKAACEKGDSITCVRIGNMFVKGQGVEIDTKQALKYYDLACDFGSGYLCLLLAWDIQYASKIIDDPGTVDRFKNKACNRGETRGCVKASDVSSAPALTSSPTTENRKNKGSVASPPSPPAPAPPPPPRTATACNKQSESSPNAEATDSKSGMFDESALDKPIRMISMKKGIPKHPTDELWSKRSGRVIVALTIDETGHVANFHVLGANSPAFIQAAVDAVKQWEYTPGKRCGSVVRVFKRETVAFNVGKSILDNERFR